MHELNNINTLLKATKPHITDVIDGIGTNAQPHVFVFNGLGLETDHESGKVTHYYLQLKYNGIKLEKYRQRLFNDANGNLNLKPLLKLAYKLGIASELAKVGLHAFTDARGKELTLYFTLNNRRSETMTLKGNDIVVSTKTTQYVNYWLEKPPITYYDEEIINGNKTRDELRETTSSCFEF